jgi:hypothetical protein
LKKKNKHKTFEGTVQIYYNINLSKKLKQPLFSIRDAKTKKVIGHDNNIVLENAIFKVSEKGRQRVLRECKKNVHALIQGKLLHTYTTQTTQVNEITYNPYKNSTFVYKDTHTPIYRSNLVVIKNKNVTCV